MGLKKHLLVSWRTIQALIDVSRFPNLNLYNFVFMFFTNTQIFYEDGDREELAKKEILELLDKTSNQILPLSSRNSCTEYYFQNEARKLYDNVACYSIQFCRQLFVGVVKEAEGDGVVLSPYNFRFIKKNFGGVDLFGFVVSFSYPYYTVQLLVVLSLLR